MIIFFKNESGYARCQAKEKTVARAYRPSGGPERSSFLLRGSATIYTIFIKPLESDTDFIQFKVKKTKA